MRNPEKPVSKNTPACPLCLSENSAGPRFEKNGYDIFRCQCGLMFVHPQPAGDVLRSIYRADYFRRGDKYAFVKNRRELDPNRQNDMMKLSLVGQYKKPGRILDVGCALGGFLETARDGGWDVTGTEISEYAASHVRNELKIEVINKGLREAGLPEESFDAVTMWDVVEHLDDPFSVVKEVHRILKSDGLLVLSTGDAESFWARLTGAWWPLLTPPQHLFFFSEKCLRKLMTSNRFSVKDMQYQGKRVSVNFVLFKAMETLGMKGASATAISRALGLNKLMVNVNLYDIVTCVAKKN